MSSEQPIQDITSQQQDEDGPEFLNEEDVLEVEELGGDDAMAVESDDDDDYEGSAHHEHGGEHAPDGEGQDDAMTLLDNGLDDSVATARLHASEGGAVFCLAVHPHAATLAVSGAEDDQAFIFRTDTGAQVARLSGHSDSVTSVGWNFDGSLVATGGMDGKVNVWKARRPSSDMAWEETGWELAVSLEGPDEVNVRPLPLTFALQERHELMKILRSQFLDWHPKGNVLMAGGADGTVWLWNRASLFFALARSRSCRNMNLTLAPHVVPSGATMHVLSGHTSSVTCGRFTPDGASLSLSLSLSILSYVLR